MQPEKVYFHSFWFEFCGKFFLYDYKHSLSMEISREMYGILYSFEEKNSIDHITLAESQIIKSLVDHDIIAGKEKFIPEVNYYDIVNMSFAPIYSCNFRCKYCFGEYGESYTGDKKTFSKDAIINAINYFVFKAFPDAKCYRLDFVSGGEPLLNFEAVKIANEHIKTIRKKYKKHILIWLCTNGSLLTDEICDYLNENNISIGISLDGTKECHDCNRIDKNGTGTYDLVVKKINGILSNRNYSKKFRSIWALSVVSKKNDNFVKILKHHMNLGIRNIQMKLVRETNNQINTQDIVQHYFELYEFLLEKFASGDLKYFFAILNANDYFGKILKRILQGNLYDKRCQAGTKKISICPDGSIYPCDSFVGDKGMCLGNLYSVEGMDLNKFKKLDVDSRNCCKSCRIRYVCGGDCYYNSYINNGDLEIPDENFCEVQRYIVKVCVALKLEMKKNNSTRLDTLIKGVNMLDGYNNI